MSFAYLPLFTGDYLRDTQHLSCSEHGIFLKLLMHCWDQKGPAPLDERKLCGIVNARSSDEIEALRRVLGEFFTRMDDGHYNHRMQREIERSEAISGARSEAGRKGYLAKAKHLPSKSQASAKQVPLSPSPSPSLPSTQDQNTRVPRSPSRALSVDNLVAEGVDPQHAADWIKARGKVPLTETAWKAVKTEAEKAGITVAQAVQRAAENGWRGFKAGWQSSGEAPRKVDAIGQGNYAAVQRWKVRHE